MAAVSRLILVLCLALFGAGAYAYPATPGGYRVNSSTGATPTAACQAATAAACAAMGNGTVYSSNDPAAYPGSCFGYCSRPGWNPWLQINQPVQLASPTCPGGGTLSGSTCVCPQGWTDTGTACQDPQAALCDALNGIETYASGPGNIAPGGSSCNATGCMTTFANTLIRVKNAQGQYVTEGAATFTGGTCTYSEATGTAEDTCPGGSSGQVNGVTVCVPYDPTLNTIESVGETDTTTTEGADTTTSTTSSTTTCANGKCSTTTGVTTSVNGGTPTTKTTTTSEPTQDYCARNRKAPQCSSAGSFTGSCQSSFVCTGDAVQCATAKATNDHFCKMKDVFEMDASTRALVDGVLAGTWVQDPKDSPRTENLGSFDQTNPLNAACPGDIAINIATVSVVIPLASFCPQLQMMGNLLVAFTLLSATVFVFRGTA